MLAGSPEMAELCQDRRNYVKVIRRVILAEVISTK